MHRCREGCWLNCGAWQCYYRHYLPIVHESVHARVCKPVLLPRLVNNLEHALPSSHAHQSRLSIKHALHASRRIMSWSPNQHPFWPAHCVQVRVVVVAASRMPHLETLLLSPALHEIRKLSKEGAWILDRLEERCPWLEVVGAGGGRGEE